MRTVKCKNTKGYKLTEGKDYEISARRSGYVYLINDNGVSAKYAEELFEAVEGSTTRRTITQTPPPPPRRTERDVINSIIATPSRISFVDIENNSHTIENPMSGNGTNISCGIAQVSGIDTLIGSINEEFDDSNEDYIPTRKALMKASIQNFVINPYPNAMVLVSTTEDSDEDLLTVLDEMASGDNGVTTSSRRNRNSRNMIKLWVFYTNQDS